MRATPLPVAVLALVLLAACAGPPPDVAPDEERVGDFLTVTGALAYRERIALAPGSVVRVSLSDVSRAEAPATLLAEQTVVLDGAQVPVGFALSVDRELLQPRRRYAVRGAIDGPDGDLRWTTDTAHSVDTAQATNDLGVLELERVAPRVEASAGIEYLCGDTAVRVRFAEDRVFLTFEGAIHELPRTASGSGARFALNAERGPMAFWDKGGEASFEAGDVRRTCVTAAQAARRPLLGTWRVAAVAGEAVGETAAMTLTFDADGRVSGDAACNAYGGRYRVGAVAGLTVGPVVATLRACPALEAIARAFLRLLGDAVRFGVAADGVLTITGEDGATIVARRAEG